MACDVEPARPSSAAAASTHDVGRDRDAMAGAVMASVSADASGLAGSSRDATDEASPIAPEVAAAYPWPQCRQGYTQRGPRLCISNLRPASNYANASSLCRNEYAAVCTYEDLYYLYTNTGADAGYNANNRWIGPLADDDYAYCGNRNITVDNDPDIANFEGTCTKNDLRRYWCCHDRE